MKLFGTLGLFLRLLLIAASGSLATLGFVEVSADGGLLTINVDQLAAAAEKWLGAAASAGAWFAWWRAASRRPDSVK